jgi:hypothetical protein
MLVGPTASLRASPGQLSTRPPPIRTSEHRGSRREAGTGRAARRRRPTSSERRGGCAPVGRHGRLHGLAPGHPWGGARRARSLPAPRVQRRGLDPHPVRCDHLAGARSPVAGAGAARSRVARRRSPRRSHELGQRAHRRADGARLSHGEWLSATVPRDRRRACAEQAGRRDRRPGLPRIRRRSSGHGGRPGTGRAPGGSHQRIASCLQVMSAPRRRALSTHTIADSHTCHST